MRRRAPLVLLVLTSLTLITLDAGTHLVQPYARAARTATATVVSPLQQQVRTLTAPDSPDELHRLRAANARLAAENGLLRAGRTGSPNQEAVRAVGQENLIPGRVVSPGGVGRLGQTVRLDVGSDDGVRRGSGVIAGDGVVGRVLRTGPSACTVLLLGDPRSTIGVRHTDSRRLGLLEGDGETAALRMVDSDTPLQPGDRLVTWGSPGGRPYPPGIPVGVVQRVDRGSGTGPTASIRPAADPSALDQVVVVR